MIKDKLTLTDLASLLADKLELSQKSAEDFVKLFFDSIEENLLANEVVKIKNLGNFKLSWNEARKSVDVNTGDEIVIDGYYKVAFAPDAVLKDLVNQPFAHLESVVVSQPDTASKNDSAARSKVSGILSETPEESVAGLAALNKQADEIKSILSEINSMNSQDVPSELMTVQPEITKDVEAESVEVETLAAEKKLEEVSAVEVEIFENPMPVSDDQEKEKELIEETSTPVSSDNSNLHAKENKSVSKKKNSFAWIWVVALLALIALAFFYKDMILPAPPAVSELPEEIIVLDSVNVNDTLAVSDSIEAPVAIPVDSLQLWFDSDRVYSEFIGTVKMSNGNRLTLISLEKYGAKEFWIYIYEANKDLIPNPDLISIGQTLKLPKLPAYVIDVKNPKCVEFARHLADELKSKGS